MAKSRSQRVADRADGCCECCQLPDVYDVRSFQLDHIRSQKHGGLTVVSNLAYSCLACNSYKGPDVSGYDRENHELVPLFNPRVQSWNEHFEWNGPLLLGKSRTGRATITLLRVNDVDRLKHRRLLIAAGVFPPRKALSNLWAGDRRSISARVRNKLLSSGLGAAGWTPKHAVCVKNEECGSVSTTCYDGRLPSQWHS